MSPNKLRAREQVGLFLIYKKIRKQKKRKNLLENNILMATKMVNSAFIQSTWNWPQESYF